MNISLRPARPGDAPRLEEIERFSFPDPKWKASDFLRYECTVAEIDGQVAGFIVVRSVSPDHEILNLAVDPARRRRGIATALLVNQLAKGGTHFLEVRASNIAAQTLYRGFGFQEVGRRSEYYDLPRESAIVMRMK